MGKNNRESNRKEKKGQFTRTLSGSHKVKNRNHSRQKNHAHHDM